MIKKKFFMTIALLCAVVQGAWAFDGSGTVDTPYLIKNAADWATFAENVNAGTDADKCYKLSDSWNNAGKRHKGLVPVSQ